MLIHRKLVGISSIANGARNGSGRYTLVYDDEYCTVKVPDVFGKLHRRIRNNSLTLIERPPTALASREDCSSGYAPQIIALDLGYVSQKGA